MQIWNNIILFLSSVFFCFEHLDSGNKLKLSVSCGLKLKSCTENMTIRAFSNKIKIIMATSCTPLPLDWKFSSCMFEPLQYLQLLVVL